MSSSEWISIFDGKNLDGWSTTGKPEGWTVEDECIVCTVQGGKYLYTQDQYENFVLSVDFKIAEKTNSGIFFRWSDLDDPVHTGIEIQIFDSYGQEVADTHTCGAIYDMVAPSSNPSKPAGEWNNILITSVSNHVSVEKNGVQIAEKTNSGIFFRWSDLDDPVHTGIEIQIFDSYGQEVATTHTCGAIYDMVAPSSNPSKPAGEWNNILIRSVPNHISVEKNGVQIAEMDVEQWEEAGKNADGSKNKFKYAWKDMPQKGHIGLQDHGGKVWFRNLKIQQL